MRIVAVLAISLAAVAAGCGSPEGSPPPSAAVTTTGNDSDLGRGYTFTTTDGPAATVRFTETNPLPPECHYAPAGAYVFAVRVELTIDGSRDMARPAAGDSIQINDRAGFTQQATVPPMNSACEIRYPALTPAPVPGKSAGWIFIQTAVTEPAALVYRPIVWAEDVSLENLRTVKVTPATVTVRLPHLPAAPSTASPSITPTPTAPPPPPTEETPAAPAAGVLCDPSTDRWGTDAAGDQLRCARVGTPAAIWVRSAPFVGNRPIGGPCTLGAAVAETSDGITLVCTGDRGAATWQPGP